MIAASSTKGLTGLLSSIYRASKRRPVFWYVLVLSESRLRVRKTLQLGKRHQCLYGRNSLDI